MSIQSKHFQSLTTAAPVADAAGRAAAGCVGHPGGVTRGESNIVRSESGTQKDQHPARIVADDLASAVTLPILCGHAIGRRRVGRARAFPLPLRGMSHRTLYRHSGKRPRVPHPGRTYP